VNELNLGELHGTLLFFGGPYGNLQAVQALKAYAENQGINPSNIICTGDTVAYCAQPNETVDLLLQWGVAVVMGNCEKSLGWNAPDCGCGFKQGSLCNTLSDSWYGFAQRNIRAGHRSWMRTLPQTLKFSYLEKRFAVIHGGVNSINRFVFASTNDHDKLQEIRAVEVDGIVAGHCGLPFSQSVQGSLWHNPGVIGMPANDATDRVWFSVWSAEQGRIEIRQKSLQYDVHEAHTNMLRAGLDNGYAAALVTGLWPSQEVLPDAEKSQQAKALREEVFYY
jgi:predicted phosphodiesterase